MNSQDIKVSKKNGMYHVPVPEGFSLGYNIVNALELDLSARFSEVQALEGGGAVMILREV